MAQSRSYFDSNAGLISESAQIYQGQKPFNYGGKLNCAYEMPDTGFGLPKDVHIYAVRPLPPVPMPNLKSFASAKCLRSTSNSFSSTISSVTTMSTSSTISSAFSSSAQSRRPSVCTTDFFDRPLPPLPLSTNTHHRRNISVDSNTSSKSLEVPGPEAPTSRLRAMKSMSFRSFIRQTYPLVNSTNSTRTSSAMSQSSEISRDSRHDSAIEDLGTAFTKTMNPSSNSAGGRRPAPLNLSALRTRKVSQEAVPTLPPLPTRPISRKSEKSTVTVRRWALFSEKTQFLMEDSQNTPPTPVSPTNQPELSCQRCYYFALRNCKGWVIGGNPGDACESCTVSLYHLRIPQRFKI